MISLVFTVDNISTVRQIYDRIRVYRAESETGPFATIDDLVPDEIELVANQTTYNAVDYGGETIHWYISQYYSTSSSGVESAWSDPVLGTAGEIFYDPLFPREISYGTSDQLVIDRIRRLIGDPIGLRREYGEDAASSIHFDNRTYEMDEKGWPADVRMNGVGYNTSTNPSVNGYRFLRFTEDISVTTMVSGIEYGVDIWYYTFRHSDREIMEAYDNCPPPAGLTAATADAEVYMVATAIDLLTQENWEDAIEDGAKIDDDGTKYSPQPGFDFRKRLLDDLYKKLDALIGVRMLGGIEGVRVD
jgi:hypothetical protein